MANARTRAKHATNELVITKARSTVHTSRPGANPALTSAKSLPVSSQAKAKQTAADKSLVQKEALLMQLQVARVRAGGGGSM